MHRLFLFISLILSSLILFLCSYFFGFKSYFIFGLLFGTISIYNRYPMFVKLNPEIKNSIKFLPLMFGMYSLMWPFYVLFFSIEAFKENKNAENIA